MEEQKLSVNWLLPGSSPSCSVSRSRNPSPGRHWHPTVVVVVAADSCSDGEGQIGAVFEEVAVESAWFGAVE